MNRSGLGAVRDSYASLGSSAMAADSRLGLSAWNVVDSRAAARSSSTAREPTAPQDTCRSLERPRVPARAVPAVELAGAFGDTVDVAHAGATTPEFPWLRWPPPTRPLHPGDAPPSPCAEQRRRRSVMDTCPAAISGTCSAAPRSSRSSSASQRSPVGLRPQNRPSGAAPYPSLCAVNIAAASRIWIDRELVRGRFAGADRSSRRRTCVRAGCSIDG